MVTVRKSTLIILSMMGIKIINPGPLAAMTLPKRKITPRSYSFKIRMALLRKKITSTMMAAKVYIRSSPHKVQKPSQKQFLFLEYLSWLDTNSHMEVNLALLFFTVSSK